MDSVAEKKLHSSAGTSKHGYWEMFYEPLNWISGCLLHKADTESTDKVFTVLQQFLNSTSSKFSLQHIFLVKCFLMNVSLERGLNDSIKWIGLIETCLQQQFQLTVDNELLATFGDLLSHTKTSNFEVPLAQKRALLNQLWPLIGKLSGLNYARTVKSIIPFVVHHFSIKELRILLQEAVQHLSGEKCSLQLQTILFEVFQATLRIEHNVLLRLYQSQAFQQLFDCLQDRSLKSEASQLLLNQFLKHDFRASLDATNKAQNSSEVSTNGHQVFRDSTHVQILMRYCKTVHDCIDCFSLNDERRHVERILLDFTQSIDFHDDPEMQLSFLIECRANFCSFESVVCQTIYSSLRLANHPIVIDRHRSHTCAKGKEFTQAALAFAIVTIPSLANPSDQLRLYLNAAQVALQCACLPQTDLFLKSSIALVSDLLNPKDGHVLTSIPPESFFNSFLSNLMSFMLVVPVRSDSFSFIYAFIIII